MVTLPHTPDDIRAPARDRAMGALSGAAAATALVGAGPDLLTRFLAPEPSPVARAAHLTRTALEGTGEPSADPLERAWVEVLRTLVRTGAAPGRADALEHAPSEDPLGVSWRALARTPVPDHRPHLGSFACTHLVDTVWAAYTTAGDLAAVYAGALAGARWGLSAIPLQALRVLSETVDPHVLVTDALTRADGARPDRWPRASVLVGEPRRLPPFAVPHPLDPQVLLGNIDHLRAHPDSVDAVVSLCRTHPSDAPHLAPVDWIRVWLHDSPEVNTNLHFTLDEAAAAVAALRAEGKRVLLHCWAGASRTPAVAARYAAAGLGAPVLPALTLLIRTVGGHLDNPSLARAVARLSGHDLPDPARSLFPEGVPPRRADLPDPRTTG
ncbi:dual specificity protein phosphatase family protein [Nocardiopsis lambiniae]|uniref:Dual specificity protein phosphatase family protein n=1 Tax=Nocardiopsis lambiniae TaxID=3075539 RepID=A0ABU2MGW6_9ACTN|nr:dual specificity protein phosphatase family protein [Nocardiopsis sp. DSM 44743]MDT0331943.1 dual specificity protein phosphatase family protein [Nocardiopsis sp. DSM 44743]